MDNDLDLGTRILKKAMDIPARQPKPDNTLHR